MNKKAQFLSDYPSVYFADGTDLQGLTTYLQTISFLDTNELIEGTSIPGAGNMNYVIRVKTNQRSFILKQSRPWVEKYPSIAAPIERIHVETLYYAQVATVAALTPYSPKVLFADKANFILLLEDLGALQDLSYLYEGTASISDEDIVSLANYAAQLHQLELDDFPENQAMRELNHAHIFDIPFQENNGLDLEAIQIGLSDLATQIRADKELLNSIAACGSLYLSDMGISLVHGDYYLGSIMRTAERLFVLDPEFCFFGYAEFDLGVFVAHIQMAKQPIDRIDLFLDTYSKATFADKQLVFAFAGIEIMRRLLGVAQLPLKLSLEEKEELIRKASTWVLAF